MATLSSLQDLFVKELRDIYDAEKQVTKALPQLVKAASSEELRVGFEQHLEETKGQIERLDRIFEQLGESSRGPKCDGMAGIIEEGEELLDEKADEAVRDAGLIAAAQKVEHYEIAAYGTLRTWAQTLGLDEAVALLEETLEEEAATDRKLTEVAESMINPEAAPARSESARGQKGSRQS